MGDRALDWLVCIWKSPLTDQPFTVSRNWLALRGANPPGSARLQISKHQNKKACLIRLLHNHNKYKGLRLVSSTEWKLSKCYCLWWWWLDPSSTLSWELPGIWLNSPAPEHHHPCLPQMDEVTRGGSMLRGRPLEIAGLIQSSISSVSKESACNAEDPGSIPGSGRCPGEGKGYPLQYSGLENSMNCIAHRVAKSRTRLSLFILKKDDQVLCIL